MKNSTGCLVVFGVLFAALLFSHVGGSGAGGGNGAAETPRVSPTSALPSPAASPSVPEDDRPLIAGGKLSIQQIDSNLQLQLAASDYELQCIHNVVRQADPSTRRGDVIEAALEACRTWGQRVAEFAKKVDPAAPAYSDERMRQTIREAIREDVGPAASGN